MENQTRFRLNTAIENWRMELAAQANLTTDDRRELETHLRDAIAGFQQRGLGEEESFLLARHRVGQPQTLADEFVKADPAKIWRERLFWIALGFLTIRLWNLLASCFSLIFYSGEQRHINRLEDVLPDWVLFYLPHWLRDFHYQQYFPVLVNVFNLLLAVTLVLFLLGGKTKKAQPLCSYALKTRSRFFATALLILAIDYLVCSLLWSFLGGQKLAGLFATYFFYNAVGIFILIAFITWLIPASNRKTPKHT